MVGVKTGKPTHFLKYKYRGVYYRILMYYESGGIMGWFEDRPDIHAFLKTDDDLDLIKELIRRRRKNEHNPGYAFKELEDILLDLGIDWSK